VTLFETAVRPVLFRVGGGDAEKAHEFTLDRLAGLNPRTLALLRRRYAVSAPTEVFGVRFPNPVGLAAGMDKNGVALPSWPALGFGFVEVGTVTAKPQPGNDKPRLFRLRDSEAVINRMGFNNEGAAALAARLEALGPIGVPLGVSLGKSKVTPLAQAVQDYLSSYELLEVCLAYGAAGVIATNTTLDRGGLAAGDLSRAGEAGGLSGRPLTERAREVVRFVHRETGGKLPIIGVGGIAGADDAARMFDAGAALIQLYTGFIYQGPALVRAAAKARR